MKNHRILGYQWNILDLGNVCSALSSHILEGAAATLASAFWRLPPWREVQWDKALLEVQEDMLEVIRLFQQDITDDNRNHDGEPNRGTRYLVTDLVADSDGDSVRALGKIRYLLRKPTLPLLSSLARVCVFHWVSLGA